MGYRLKKNESVPDGIKRIALEEIDSATQHLAATTNRDEAVHEARKSLKKIRGALRLVRGELGRAYQVENAQLRAIGRKLSELRDATAIIEVFDDLVGQYKDQLRSDALGSIRRALEDAKQETERAVGADEIIEQSIAILRAARERVPEWPLQSNGFEALVRGLKNGYRRGRQAMAHVRKHPTPENYHDWRKRVKDHWYHVRLLEAAWTDLLQVRERALKELESALGDDHNFVVLCAKVEGNPDSFGERADIDLFRALSAQHQRYLRDTAFALGERLYEEKPGDFTWRVSKLWHIWQSDPVPEDEPKRTASPVPKRAAQVETANSKKHSAA